MTERLTTIPDKIGKIYSYSPSFYGARTYPSHSSAQSPHHSYDDIEVRAVKPTIFHLITELKSEKGVSPANLVYFKDKSREYLSNDNESIHAAKITAFHSTKTALYFKAAIPDINHNLSSKEIELLALGGLVHDVVGKNDPELKSVHQYEKPYKEEEGEKELMNKHTKIGAEELELQGFPNAICKMTQLHHVNIDGSGYPAYPPEEVPSYVWPLHLADVLESMTTHRRLYNGGPKTFPEAFRELRSRLGEKIPEDTAEFIDSMERELTPTNLARIDEIAKKSITDPDFDVFTEIVNFNFGSCE